MPETVKNRKPRLLIADDHSIMLAGLREKMRYSDIPAGLEGVGIAFFTTGLISLAFMGIAGLSF